MSPPEPVEPTGRRAFICKAKGHQYPADPYAFRIFLLPGQTEVPRCPEHGNTMVRQENVPYRRSTRTKWT